MEDMRRRVEDRRKREEMLRIDLRAMEKGAGTSIEREGDKHSEVDKTKQQEEEQKRIEEEQRRIEEDMKRKKEEWRRQAEEIQKKKADEARGRDEKRKREEAVAEEQRRQDIKR